MSSAAIETVFGSLDNYSKGSVEIISGQASHYAFSNVFEVAEKSLPYEKVVVGLNLGYVIETLRAEGQSPWYTAAHDEFAIVMDGEVRVDFLKLDTPLTDGEGTRLAGEIPAGKPMGYALLEARPSMPVAARGRLSLRIRAVLARYCSRQLKARCRSRSGQTSASSDHRRFPLRIIRKT